MTLFTLFSPFHYLCVSDPDCSLCSWFCISLQNALINHVNEVSVHCCSGYSYSLCYLFVTWRVYVFCYVCADKSIDFFPDCFVFLCTSHTAALLHPDAHQRRHICRPSLNECHGRVLFDIHFYFFQCLFDHDCICRSVQFVDSGHVFVREIVRMTVYRYKWDFQTREIYLSDTLHPFLLHFFLLSDRVLATTTGGSSVSILYFFPASLNAFLKLSATLWMVSPASLNAFLIPSAAICNASGS